MILIFMCPVFAVAVPWEFATYMIARRCSSRSGITVRGVIAGSIVAGIGPGISDALGIPAALFMFGKSWKHDFSSTDIPGHVSVAGLDLLLLVPMMLIAFATYCSAVRCR